jgi:hypothetical protein
MGANPAYAFKSRGVGEAEAVAAKLGENPGIGQIDQAREAGEAASLSLLRLAHTTILVKRSN